MSKKTVAITEPSDFRIESIGTSSEGTQYIGIDHFPPGYGANYATYTEEHRKKQSLEVLECAKKCMDLPVGIRHRFADMCWSIFHEIRYATQPIDTKSLTAAIDAAWHVSVSEALGVNEVKKP